MGSEDSRAHGKTHEHSSRTAIKSEDLMMASCQVSSHLCQAGERADKDEK
jgi:hypothetical protein